MGPESSLDDTLHRIRAFAPDVIIMNEGYWQRESTLNWQCLLCEMPGLRLVVLNTQIASLSIYEGKTHTVMAAADLLAAVQSAGQEPPAAY